MTHLTDTEVVRTLYAAGIPPLYHRKTSALANIEPAWPEIAAASEWAEKESKDFAALGKGIEIAFDSKVAYDFTYLLARKLQLLAVPVSVVSLPVLSSTVASRHESESIERLDEWNGSSFLFVITGFTPDPPPYDRKHMFEVEWFLRSWLLSGRSLVLQGEGRLADCAWWSNGLRSLFNDRLALRFNGPPANRKPTPSTSR